MKGTGTMPRFRNLAALAALLAGCCAVAASALTAPKAVAAATTARGWGVAQRGVWQTAKPIPGVAKTERGIGVGGVSCPAAGDCAGSCRIYRTVQAR
jgi:hypothetical protein